MRALVFAAVATLCSACATFGTHQTARPIDQGSLQVGIEPGMWHVKDSGAAPLTNLSARYGFGRRWDLGVRLGSSGVGVSSKLQLTRDPRAALVVALAPSVTGAPWWGSRPIHVQVPLLVGLGVGPHELTVGPRLQAWSSTRPAGLARQRRTLIAAGISLGGAVRITRGVRLVPEVTFVRPLTGALDTRAAFSDVELRPGRPLYQVSLGVLLGGETAWWRRQSYPWYGPYSY